MVANSKFKKKIEISERVKKIRLEKARAEKVKRKFRPKKSEILSFVFVGLDGKRLPINSRRKGYFIYVGRGKKKSVFKERGKSILPRRIKSIDISHPTRRKIAQKRYYESILTEFSYSKTKATKSESDGVSYPRFVVKLSKDLRKTVGLFKQRGNFVIDVSFVVEYENGKLETHQTRIPFSQKEKQILLSKDYKNFISTKVYAYIAAQLSDRNLVSSGSARFISQLEQNRYEERDDWTKADGRPWNKSGFEEVRVLQLEYRISKVSFR